MTILGQNLGLGEIWTPADITEAATHGAPSARIVNRWLGSDPPPGYGTNFQVDGFADDQPHNIRPENVAMLVAQAEATRAVGGEVMLGNDSNQLQGLMGGMDLWTPDGKKRRAQFIRLARYLAKQIRPTWLELIVEPNSPNMSPAGLWDFYEEGMANVLDSVPGQRFAIGCRGYQPNYIGEAYRPEWAAGRFAGHIDLTCNFQDDLVCNPVLFEDRLGKVLRERDEWGVGVVVNQLWSFPQHDIDGAFLARAVRRLAEEGVPSFIWTAVTRYPEGAGLRYLADSRDPESAHIKHAARWAAVTAVWRDAS
jgi:hypothetical protein